MFGEVRIRAGPSTSLGSRAGVASALRRPCGLRLEAQAARWRATRTGESWLFESWLASSATSQGFKAGR